MADVSLDDLIKKDKEKTKTFHKNKTAFKPKKTFGKFKPNRDQNDRPRKFNNKHFDRNDRDDDRPQDGGKTKIIRKEGQGRINRGKFDRDNRNRDENNPRRNSQTDKRRDESRSQKEDEKEEKNLQKKRTLKVMGLSPQFTNEDLYVEYLMKVLEALFNKCLIEQDNFGRSLTTAVVKYHNSESAQNAIKNIDKHKIMNCILTVEPYKFVKRR